MGLKDLPGRFARWSYRGGRPSRLTNLLNGGWAFLHGLGVLPDFLVTLEVRGRRSGRVYANPMVVATVGGKSYLVSMLGERAPWVQNVRAADGHVTIKRGTREAVRLEEVPVEERPPILKAYLRRAPGARPHVPVPKDAPLERFAAVAAHYPVFRIIRATIDQGDQRAKATAPKTR